MTLLPVPDTVRRSFCCAFLVAGCATTGSDRSTGEANAYVAGMVAGAVMAHNTRDDAHPHSTLKQANRELDKSRTHLWLSFLNAVFGSR